MTVTSAANRQPKELIPQIRLAVLRGELSPMFTRAEVLAVGIPDPNHNLSNYAVKNKGANNTKSLLSRDIRGTNYYAFNEMLFDR